MNQNMNVHDIALILGFFRFSMKNISKSSKIHNSTIYGRFRGGVEVFEAAISHYVRNDGRCNQKQALEVRNAITLLFMNRFRSGLMFRELSINSFMTSRARRSLDRATSTGENIERA